MNSKIPAGTTGQIDVKTITSPGCRGFFKRVMVCNLAAFFVHLGMQATFAANGNDTWQGNTSPNWNTGANWSISSANTPPIGGDWLFFGTAGSSGSALVNDETAATSFSGITFNSGASTFTVSGNSITLTGGITNGSTSLQTIGLPIVSTVANTLVTTPGGGNLTLNGGITGTGGALNLTGGGKLALGGANSYTAGTTVTGSTLTFTGNNTLPLVGNLSLLGGSSILDLAGTSQATASLIGTDANNATPTGSYVTNSGAGVPVLTLNEGTANNFQFREGVFCGPMGLLITGNLMNVVYGGGNAFQMQVAGNTFSGGLKLSGAGTTALSTTNLNSAGGYIITGLGNCTNTAVMRLNNNVSIGTGALTLDNGDLWSTTATTLTNPIVITSRGGILRTENNSSVFLGPISGSGLLSLACSQQTMTFSNDLSGFTGTLAVDSGSTCGLNTLNLCVNSPACNLLFFGTGKTGILQWNGSAVSPVTLTFGEVSSGVNGGSIAVGQLSSGVATTVTYQIGDNTLNTPAFGGAIVNGSGTVAVTKIGNDTQTLSGANTYTGLTAVGGGVLILNGVNSGTGGYTVSNNATLSLGATGHLQGNGAVNVNAGGTLATGGAIGGQVTLASGNAAINLQDGNIDTLSLSNGLTLNNGNVLSFDLGSGADSIAVLGGTYTKNSGTVTVNVAGIGFSAGVYPLITGASISSTSGFVLSQVPASSSYSYNLVANSGNLALQVSLAVVSPPNAFWKGGVDNNWSTADSGGLFNWATGSSGATTTGGKPGAVTAVTFSTSGAANQSTVLGGNFEISSLTVTTPSAVGIGGANTLQLDTGGLTINAGAGNVNITNKSLVLGGTELWTNNSADTLSVSAPISGLSVLTLGGGSTVLSGTNTHGGTMVVAGRLALSGNGTLGSSSASIGAIGGTIDLGGSSQPSGSVALYNGGVISNGVITASTGYDLQSGTISAILGGGSAVPAIKSTPNTVILSANNTFSGQTVVSNGVLQIGVGGANGTFNPGSIAISNSATLLFDSTGGQTNGSLVSGNGSLTIAGGGLVQLANQLSTFNGNTLVDGSTLAAAAGNNSVNAPYGPLGSSTVAHTITLTNGAALSLVGGNVLGSGISTVCDVTTVVNQNCQILLNASPADANILGPVILNGGQMVVGNGYNASFQGAILLGGVTVGGTNSSAITTNSAGNSAVDGVMLGAMGTDAAGNLGSLVQFTVNPTGSSGPDLTVSASLVDPAYSPNVGGAVAGDGGINLQGTGTMLLTAINPYSGPTFVTSGKLVVSSIQGATGMTNYVAVNDGAALGVVVSGTSQWSPVTLSLGAGSANILEFTGINNTSVAPLNPGDLSISGTTTINIVSAASVVGTYPLVSNWDGSGSVLLGSLPANVLAAHLDTSTSTIKLVITSVSGPSLTPPTMTNSFSAGNLTLNWPTDHIGYRLQVQTNSLSVGLGTNWSTWAGSAATNQEIIPVSTVNGSVFFRLVYP